MKRVPLRATGAGAQAKERLFPRAEVLGGLGAVSERVRTRWALGGCLLLTLVLRAPYMSVPLGRDEGGLAFIARHWRGGGLYGDYWVDRPPFLIGLFKVAVLGGAGGVRVLGALAALALVVAIALLAQAVAGARAGRIAGLLAALLAGSVSIGSNFTPGELLAVVPSTLSVLCLVLAHRSRETRFVVAAGALAVTAVLVKQSFLDAGAAGVAFVAASAVADRDVRRRWPVAYVAGGAVPLVIVLAWLAVAQVSLSYFAYTMFGFRLELLHTLAGSDIPLQARLQKLETPIWESGLAVALVGALLGLRHLRGDRVLVVTFTVWLAAAVVGVLGGGSYFAHYLIELIPVSCVAAAVVIAAARRQIRWAVLAVFLVAALPTAYRSAVDLSHHPMRGSEVAVARYLRDHARPGETDYVMYARPNVVYYAGLRHPYPYMWSLMVRARPGARERLVRELGSRERPTWLVKWQDVDDWGLDDDERLVGVLGRGYRLAATVCGRGIYVRSDRVPRPPLSLGTCP